MVRVNGMIPVYPLQGSDISLLSVKFGVSKDTCPYKQWAVGNCLRSVDQQEPLV